VHGGIFYKKSADCVLNWTNKIRGTEGQPGNPVLLLNLAGFCLVASVSSRAFIGSLTERLMREVRDAREQAETATAEQARQRAADATEAALIVQSDAEAAQALARAQVAEEASVDTATTAPRQRSGPPQSASLGTPAPALAQEKRVLLALTEGEATLRTVAGVAQDSQLDEATVLTVLSHLQQKAWALHLAGSDGQPRWFATAAGKAQTRVAQPA
jgi:hypothetical protein